MLLGSLLQEDPQQQQPLYRQDQQEANQHANADRPLGGWWPACILFDLMPIDKLPLPF